MWTSLVLAGMLTQAPAPPSLAELNAQRQSTQRSGMWILGSWAAANIAVGTVGALAEKDPRWQRFHLGNAIWNSVNLGLAVVGLVTTREPLEPSLKASLNDADAQSKAFGINAGIDLGYLAFSAFLWQRADATGDQAMLGFAQSLLVQGAFLAVFDTVMFVLMNGHELRLFESLTVGPGVVAGRF